MNPTSRTYNSIVNSLYGIIASVITVLLNFVVRIFLVRELGEEINGLHNLFQSIISVLTIVEMSISLAMIIHLYEPVKDNDKALVRGLMNFYKKIYNSIAIIFFVISAILTIFIGYIVESTIPLNIVRLYFMLFAMSFVMHYLTYYSRNILFADQRNRVSANATALSEVLFRTVQIATIILFHNYILFLLLWIAEKVTANLMCRYYVAKHYSYLAEKNNDTISASLKQSIYNKIKPLLTNQISSAVQQSSSSILISILLGNIKVVGYFGNYNLIASVIMLLYSQFGAAFTSSFGNLAVEHDTARMKKALFKSAFILDSIAAICCACFMACSSDFIHFLFGGNFVLDTLSVIAITVNLIVYLISVAVISAQNALGLHRLDAKWMVAQAVSAIVLEIIFGKMWGMPGIFLGLIIPTFIFSVVNKGVIVCLNALQINRGEYVEFIFLEILNITVAVTLSLTVCKYIIIENLLLSCVVKAVISLVISAVVVILFSFKREEFAASMTLVKGILNKRNPGK